MSNETSHNKIYYSVNEKIDGKKLKNIKSFIASECSAIKHYQQQNNRANFIKGLYYAEYITLAEKEELYRQLGID